MLIVNPVKRHELDDGMQDEMAPSRTFFPENEEEILAEIKEAPRDYFEAKRQVGWQPNSLSFAKVVQALLRECYCCLATRAYDFRCMLDPRLDPKIPKILFNEGGVYTLCAHIVPDSAYLQLSENPSV
jgi:hypothetical protein